MASNSIAPEKRFRISLLLDTYGELLTDKQRDFMQRYYEEDYSFGEIAAECGVSRQAIFDAVKHGEASLENYESVLGLVDQSPKGEGKRDSRALKEVPLALDRIADQLRELGEGSDLAERLEKIATEIEAAANRIDSVAREVGTSGEIEPDEEVEIETQKPKVVFLRNDGPEID